MQTVCAPFVPQAAATHGKNLPAVVFQTAEFELQDSI